MATASRLNHPLSSIAAALRNGETTAAALLDEAQDNHGRWGEKLNAYLTWAPALARLSADAADASFTAGHELGLLQGIPLSIKDLYGIRGYPTYAGSGKKLPEKWEREGPVVRAIKAQIAVITGKTHTVEFAAGGIGDNIHWGAPYNPWDPENHRGPGGSSSGAGVSLWECSALVAFGSDTMGSVRIPASMTGVVGLKITYDRWSNDGIVPLRTSQDTPGPLTRTVADAAFVFAALDPAHRAQPQKLLDRLAGAEVSRFTFGVADKCFWDDCGSGIAETVGDAIAALEQAGARTVDAPSKEIADLFDFVMSGSFANPTPWVSELVGFLKSELPDWVEQLDPGLQERLQAGRKQTAAEFIQCEKFLSELRDTAPANFDSIDVMVAPTLVVSPPILTDGKPHADPSTSPIISARNTCAANFLQQCAITIPVGKDAEGMPVGLQLTAPGGEEEKLLAVATAVEGALGTARDRLGIPPALA